MKRDVLQEYQQLLSGIYGRRTPAVRVAPSVMASRSAGGPRRFTRSFDDGAPVEVPETPGPEYDVTVDNPRFDRRPYEAAPAPAAAPAVSAPQSRVRTTAPHYAAPLPVRSEAPSQLAPLPRASAPEVAAPAEPEAGAPRAAAQSAYSERQLKQLVKDEDFFADIQSILKGEKPPPPAPKPEKPAPNPAPTREPEKAASNNEHAIFDRIAENMRYATAYELGSIDLGTRFDAFDRDASRSKALPVVRPDKPNGSP